MFQSPGAFHIIPTSTEKTVETFVHKAVKRDIFGGLDDDDFIIPLDEDDPDDDEEYEEYEDWDDEEDEDTSK